MPKIFEYLGITIMFYSNEHEPIHVHGKYQAFESKDNQLLHNTWQYLIKDVIITLCIQ